MDRTIDLNQVLRPVLVALVALTATVAMLVLAPAQAQAMTLAYPQNGQQFDYLQLSPPIAAQPVTGERPKWILISTDAQVASPIRYCRAWYGATMSIGYVWTCNAHSIGVDHLGNDVRKPLEWGKTYYWKVVYEKDGAERSSEVRSFTIKNKPYQPTPGEISDAVADSTSGSTLNTGAAAYISSGLRVTSIRAVHNRYRFYRIEVAVAGAAKIDQSYVSLTGPHGTQRLKLTRVGNKLVAYWGQPLWHVRARKTYTYRYQAFLPAVKNGAVVRSELRYMVIRPR